MLIFTDRSSKGKSAVHAPGYPPIVKINQGISAQQAEIIAVIEALKHFLQPLHLFTDSAYVAGLFPAMETTVISGTSSIHSLLRQLQQQIHKRKHKLAVTQVKSHMALPRPISKVNQIADLLTQDIVALTAVKEAQLSHEIHHQNALTLKRLFDITRKQARHIVKTCSQCPDMSHLSKMGVNPRGLRPNDL